MVLPAALVVAGGVAAVFGFLLYQITHPAAVPGGINPSHYLLPSVDVSWPGGDAREIPGWWIPGVKGSPAILLAPGYGMSRADSLSLAVVLHRMGFNLLTYDQKGSGAQPRGASSLGLKESADMLAALDFLKSRNDVDASRLGVWGVDVAARAALSAAAQRVEVRALALDGAYEDVGDFLALQVREQVGSENRILEFGSRNLLRFWRALERSADDRLPLEPLSDRSVLFIQGENRRDLAGLSTAVYKNLKPSKEMLTLPTSRARFMNREELGSYDRQVANFFHLNLGESSRARF
jgi:hypothetical protein